MKYIYLLIGPSGSGKDTIAKTISKQTGKTSIASYTTRPPRYAGEDTHTFVPERNCPREEIVGYTVYNNYEYWVTKSQVEENDMYVVDVDGAQYLFDNYFGEKIPVVVAISCSAKIRKQRMKARGDATRQIWSRLHLDKKVFGENFSYFLSHIDRQCIVWEINNDDGDGADKLMQFMGYLESIESENHIDVFRQVARLRFRQEALKLHNKTLYSQWSMNCLLTKPYLFRLKKNSDTTTSSIQ